jgi:SAM-dependent methyltransferase
MVHEGSTHFVHLLQRDSPNAERILVVGCGYNGGEIFSLAEALPHAFIEGFDINLDPKLENLQTERYHITRGDACAMRYPDESFDAVFYHLVIEHVPCLEQSIAECARVLKHGGYLYCGTPNRSRLVGYIGSRASLGSKIRWNLADWKMRLKGKFRNECGAHAGFTEAELDTMLRPYFGEIHWLTADYLEFKYGHKLPRSIMRLILWKPLRRVLAPAMYRWARKK